MGSADILDIRDFTVLHVQDYGKGLGPSAVVPVVCLVLGVPSRNSRGSRGVPNLRSVESYNLSYLANRSFVWAVHTFISSKMFFLEAAACHMAAP